MATYIFGDLQGCYEPLLRLLDLIGFDANRDQLGFIGDLVNRGPDSLQVLRFIQQLKNPLVVLGNHDVYLLRCFYHIGDKQVDPSLQKLLAAPDCAQLLAWLRQQPVLYQMPHQPYVMVHAGIPPQWTIAQALDQAELLHAALRAENPAHSLQQLWGDFPDCWAQELSAEDQRRYTLNAFTRMRCCDAQGTLDLRNKTATCKAGLRPWFEWRQKELKQNTRILFGHWAALQGVFDHPLAIGLDTGCVWGHTLTAYCLETQERFQVLGQ